MTKVPDKKPKVELMPEHTDMQKFLDLPDKPEDYLEELPEAREECIRMISKNMAYLAGQTTLRYWFVGRIIATLEERKEEKVLEELETRIGYKQRNLQYIRALYLKFPNFALVEKASTCGLEWSDFRLLTSIKDQETRDATLQKLIEGTLERTSIPDEIERLAKLNAPPTPPSVEPTPEGEKESDKKPVQYFQKLEKKITAFQEDLSLQLAEFASMYDVTQNETLVEEAEYNTICSSVAKIITTVKPLMEILKDLYQNSCEKFEVKAPKLKE